MTGGQQTRLVKALVYGFTIVLSVSALSYYSLVRVPAQREYSLNLRFRTLAVTGSQVRAKLASLATALEKSNGDLNYLRALVPDFEGFRAASAEDKFAGTGMHAEQSPEGPRLVFCSGTLCAWARMSDLFGSLTSDELFDDVLLARGGEVIYQRRDSSPRVLRLAGLEREEIAAAPSAGASPQPSASRRDAERGVDRKLEITLDGSAYTVLVQPLRASFGERSQGDAEFQICALVRSSRLRYESMHVPPKLLLWPIVILAFALLSGPFLKLLLLTGTGRFTSMDLLQLATFTLVAAAVCTLLIFSFGARNEPLTDGLPAFAAAIEDQMTAEFSSLRDLLSAIDASRQGSPEVADSTSNIPGRSNVWRDPKLLQAWNSLPPSRRPDFDFVFWAGADGAQLEKWTTKTLRTAKVDLLPYQYFREVLAGNHWRIQGDSASAAPFFVEAQISPTTARLVVALSIPTERKLKTRQGLVPAKVAAIIAEPLSILDPLVPPEVGFAIIDPSGRVLFHSRPERNLQENFFEECGAAPELRAGISSSTDLALTTYYRGKSYDLYARPVGKLQGNNWTIIVFREREPFQALIGQVWLAAGSLWTGVFIGILLFLGLALLILRIWFEEPGRELLNSIWPRPERRLAYRWCALALGASTVVSMTVAAVARVAPYEWLGNCLLFFLLLPFAAAGMVVWIRLRTRDFSEWPPASAGKSFHTLYTATAFLLLLQIAVVPMMGFLFVSQAQKTWWRGKWWQLQYAKRIEQHTRRRLGEVRRSAAYSPEARDFLLANHFPPTAAASPLDRPYAYHAAFARTEVSFRKDRARTRPESAAWWEQLLGWPRQGWLEDGGDSGMVPNNRIQSGPTLWFAERSEGRESLVLERSSIDESGAPALLRIESSGHRSGPGAGLLLLGCLLLTGTYFWISSSTRRIFLIDFEPARLPRLGPKLQGTRTNLIVLGLPMAKKDEAVRKFLGFTPPRINLHAERFFDGWLELTVDRMSRELHTPAEPLSLAASAGGAPPVARSQPSREAWIHISNLECKLNDPQDRRVLLALLGRLLSGDGLPARPRLVVTSLVDPLVHFESILSTEKAETYSNALPELEVQRWGRTLHQLQKVSVSPPEGSEVSAEGVATAELRVLLENECRLHRALVEVKDRVVARALARPFSFSTSEALAMFQENAQAFYELAWSSCTRPEKLMLLQLARGGLVNPRSPNVLRELERKSLIVLAPNPRIMNRTFRDFLDSVESAETLREWESEAGESGWLIIRNVLGILVLLLLGFFAATQHEALQGVVAALSAAGGVIATVPKALEMIARARQKSRGAESAA